MTTQNAAERPAGGQWAYPVRAVEWGTFWRLLDAEDGWVADAPNWAMAEAVAAALNVCAQYVDGLMRAPPDQWGRELWLAVWMEAVGERFEWLLSGLAILQRGASC